MAKDFLLGIDIGTSACKVAVFDLDGKVICQTTKGYPLYYPAPGYVEQNPEEWWQSVCLAIAEVLAAGKIDSQAIAGIGIDGQSWSAIPVDKSGRVLCNTPIWMDTRAGAITERVVAELGFEQIFAVSGNPFAPTYTTPKIIWFKENQPELFQQTKVFLQSNSYIAFKLTGVLSQDRSQGYGLHCFNMQTGEYDEPLADLLGIPLEKLPAISACHQIIGEVTPAAAAATGLKPGIPVVAGGLDAACGTLGAGVIQSGQTQEQGGQAGGMSICMDRPLAHPKLILGFHVVPDLWLLQGGTVGGGCLKWFKQELGRDVTALAAQTGKNAFDLLVEEAVNVGPGADGVVFLPYMAGERSPIWDEHAQGVYFGLSYNKTRAHMLRATLEGCAYALAHNLQTAAETGVKVDELRAMGGAANSWLWTQIKADVTGKVIRVPASDTATTLGAAILAGVGVGAYPDFATAVARTIQLKRTHLPDPKAHAIYQKSLQIYLELYGQLKDLFRKSEGLK